MNIQSILADRRRMNAALINRSKQCWLKFDPSFRRKNQLVLESPIEYLNAMIIRYRPNNGGEVKDLSVPFYLFDDLNHSEWNSFASNFTKHLNAKASESLVQDFVRLLCENPHALETLTNLNFTPEEILEVTGSSWVEFEVDLNDLINNVKSQEDFEAKWKVK